MKMLSCTQEMSRSTSKNIVYRNPQQNAMINTGLEHVANLDLGGGITVYRNTNGCLEIYRRCGANEGYHVKNGLQLKGELKRTVTPFKELRNLVTFLTKPKDLVVKTPKNQLTIE